MNVIGDFFTAVIIDPIFNALIFFYNIFGDIGLAIIALTALIRIILFPLSGKAFKAQRRMQSLQPEMKRLQEKHKDDKEALSKEMMAFYKKEGVNPASSCLPTLVQIPVLIALYIVFKDAITGQHLDHVYSFIQQPASIDPYFLGINLSSTGAHLANIVLAVITGGLQFMQSRMLMPKNQDGPAMNRQIMYLFPILTFVFALTLPAALPLYWATSTLFMIGQQYYIIKKNPLAEAHEVAVKDWDKANPQDPVGKDKPKKQPEVLAVTKKKGSAKVTIRKRGE
jgi:YidC/Oxa1 family membrane protein insertase